MSWFRGLWGREDSPAGMPMQFVRALDLDTQVVRIGVSCHDELIVVTSAAEPGSTYAGTTEVPGWAVFPRSTAEQCYTLEVAIHAATGATRTMAIDGVPIAFPQVQTLPDGGLFLAGSRSHFRDGAGEHNAFLVDGDGRLGRSFCIGDGVQSVQVTAGGLVWVSYFDEGIFGNMGWGESEETTPLGDAGLVCWSVTGERLHRFEPPDELGTVDDCYAMSTVGETAWLCYYSDFPICRATVGGATTGWRNEITGAQHIAVHGKQVALIGGWGDAFSRYVVCHLGDGGVKQSFTSRLTLPDGSELPSAATIVARGRFVHAVVDGSWYRLDISTAHRANRR